MKLKVCSFCGKETVLWKANPKACKSCWGKHGHSDKENVHAPKCSSIKKTFPKPTGELILFKAIWDTRPHVCFITGEPIHEFNVGCFAHILSKGAYPKFRLFDKNIMLVTREAHNEYDNGDRGAPEFEEVMKIHDELIKQYYTNI